jgi:hypothetical protein
MYKEQVCRDLLSGDPQAILQFIMAHSLQLFLHLEKSMFSFRKSKNKSLNCLNCLHYFYIIWHQRIVCPDLLLLAYRDKSYTKFNAVLTYICSSPAKLIQWSRPILAHLISTDVLNKSWRTHIKLSPNSSRSKPSFKSRPMLAKLTYVSQSNFRYNVANLISKYQPILARLTSMYRPILANHIAWNLSTRLKVLICKILVK